MAARFTAQDVLQFLDSCLEKNPTWVFIDLGHPYVYTANSRLTLYADDARWAIVSEVSGYNPRAGVFLLTVTSLGNCLERLQLMGSRKQFTYNAEFITLIEGIQLHEATRHFASAATPVELQIRDHIVMVPDGKGTFVPKTKSGTWPKGARAEDLGRYVAYEYAELCRATDAEKRMHLPASLPELMKIDEWYHRSWYYGHGLENPQPIGDAPSSYETYRLIAAVLANRDPSRYRPTLKPNSHWTNWPQAGSL